MGKPLRVLIVEDSPDDADLVALQLRQGGYEPDWERVDSAAAMRAALGRRKWDAIICDYRMPGFSGPQALGLLKELGLDLPFIIVSGTIGEDLAVEVMKAGAGDYLLKGHLARLCPAVERELKEAQMRRGRRKAESHQKLAIDLLSILNHTDEAQKLISGLAHLLKENGRFDAVGVRLREGEDYPYCCGEGFPAGFLAEAASLCAQDAAGKVVRDAAGAPVLECFCGAVIRGRTDAAMPCFTQGGSFWTNSMGDLFASAAGMGVGQAVRRHCLQAGFESVTLVPLRSGAEVIGLLQFAAGRRGRFDPEDIAFLEDMAVSVGIALRRQRAEEEHGKLEEQLRQSQKMEAVGRLAGGVAHDFNNLLTAISGYSEFLLAALPAGDPKRADVEEIKKAGERAATLTRQLLAFSRKQVLQPRVLSLDSAIPEMSQLIRRVIGEDIEFRTALAAAPANVKADPGQIEQVIMNLVVNARDAMPDGGKLTLETAQAELGEDYARAHPDVAPGRYVMLAVSDTGCGMSPDVIARIFEPFFTTKERGKGTGLGLSTVYGIVKQSGGSIFVYSEPEQGTSFKVYFPRVDEQAVKESASQPPLSSCCGTEKILVVEDDETVRRLVCRVLSENGYSVMAAVDPREALQLCASHKDILLMITDVVMPQMNGRELARRAASLCPKMKIVFMSGYTDNVIAHHGVLEAGLALLEKPLTPEAVLRKVRGALDA